MDASAVCEISRKIDGRRYIYRHYRSRSGCRSTRFQWGPHWDLSWPCRKNRRVHPEQTKPAWRSFQLGTLRSHSSNSSGVTRRSGREEILRADRSPTGTTERTWAMTIAILSQPPSSTAAWIIFSRATVLALNRDIATTQLNSDTLLLTFILSPGGGEEGREGGV